MNAVAKRTDTKRRQKKARKVLRELLMAREQTDAVGLQVLEGYHRKLQQTEHNKIMSRTNTPTRL